MGRKASQLTQIDHVLSELEAGRSLRDICKNDPVMPKPSTFLDWVAQSPELAERYTRAREAGAEKRAEELEHLVDAEYIEDKDGRIDSARVNARRLQVDTKKWLLSKMFPKKYGDKVDLNHSGSIQTSAAEIIKNIHESRKINDDTDTIQSGES